ncbi:hypothetical protein BU15DRAFT_81443 [Melanogaster broomeanus]|nr:hypothetical protein BU15DRAFT_81443 [Melanogaster broomeanus]
MPPMCSTTYTQPVFNLNHAFLVSPIPIYFSSSGMFLATLALPASFQPQLHVFNPTVLPTHFQPL